MPTGTTTHLLPCPYCGAVGVDSTWVKPGCTGCMGDWADWKTYWLDVTMSGISRKKVPTPVPAPPPATLGGDWVDDYISSGDMKRDIEKLIQRAVADAIYQAKKEMYDEFSRSYTGSMDDTVAIESAESALWKAVIEAKDERNRHG